MQIFEVNEVANSSVLYQFHIKERELFLFSDKFRTNKWLSLENWSYIYKKLSTITENYVKHNQHNSTVVNLPGNLMLNIKFNNISDEIKKVLGLKTYRLMYYLNVHIEYKPSQQDSGELHQLRPLAGVTRHKKSLEYSPSQDSGELQQLRPLDGVTRRKKSREYSPSQVLEVHDNHYTPLPANNQKMEAPESSTTYKPAPLAIKYEKDEYVPASGTKEKESPDISYKPTRIEELSSQTSNDSINGGGGGGSSKRRRKYESLNEDFLSSKNKTTLKSMVATTLGESLAENNKRSRKKKKQLTKLFQDESDSNSESTVTDNLSQQSQPNNNASNKKENITTKDANGSSSSRSKKKKTRNGNDLPSKFNLSVLGRPPKTHKLNCHQLPIKDIEDSFKTVQSKFTTCIDDFYDAKNRKKTFCDDPLIVHELFTEEQIQFMYERIQDCYLSANDSGANYAQLMTNSLLPAWGLHLCARFHKIPDETIYETIKDSW